MCKCTNRDCPYEFENFGRVTKIYTETCTEGASILKYLTDTSPTVLLPFFKSLRAGNDTALSRFTKALKPEEQELVEEMVTRLKKHFFTFDKRRCLTQKKARSFMMDNYLKGQFQVMTLKQKLMDRIASFFHLTTSVEKCSLLGFDRVVFPGKTQFSGKTALGVDLAVNIIADALHKESFPPYYVSIHYCELFGLESDYYKLSKITRNYLSLKSTIDSFNFIQRHPAIFLPKYRQEIQFQAWKSELSGDRKYVRHCIYQLNILICASSIGDYYIENVKENHVQLEFFKEFLENTEELIREKCNHLKATYLKNFEYNFEPPEEKHEFVVDVPKNSIDKRFARFEALHEKVKESLLSEDLVAIKAEFKKLSPAEFKKNILICAQEGFFYFAVEIDLTEFRMAIPTIEALDVYSDVGPMLHKLTGRKI